MGVFPAQSNATAPASCLPHARGGVSNLWRLSPPPGGSSPRPWGCFQSGGCLAQAFVVFPTPVGVFPRVVVCLPIQRCLPHARGGVSIYPSMAYQQDWVFPTPVGVFLVCTAKAWGASGLPHARGGVSFTAAASSSLAASSPRPWGCFYADALIQGAQPVFPTPVGVFPIHTRNFKGERRLPHARGGVSNHRPFKLSESASSPRPWGCFIARLLQHQ